MEFDEFVSAEIAGLARYAGVLTRDRQLAHDVLVDALLTASDRWSRISLMDSPIGYVRRIVATTYLTDRRRTARRRTDPVPAAAIPERAVPVASDRIRRGPASVDDRDETDRLLASLPRQQRAALVLRFYLDWPDEEIAAALGCTTGTVRSHVSRALATLRVTVTAADLGGER
jgi:RNA polymerase sigma factor (sigma-70 family)